ncbi:hypothetical protein H3C66_04475 [Patescibacteria group bacterium]|nr:hypothetical protein [Patescibacteria group bacterium]
MKKIAVLLVVVVLVLGGVAGWYFLIRRPATLSELPTGANDAFFEEETFPIEGDELSESDFPITAFIMSDKANGLSATVFDHQNRFASTTEIIYLTVKLPEDTPVQRASLTVTYVDDGSILGPVSSPAKFESGISYVTFEMKKPASNWPIGEYIARLDLSTGENQEYSFTIE